MKINDIKKMTTEEIVKEIDKAKEEIFSLRFQIASGKLEKPSRIRELRKNVARMKTVISERKNEA